MNSTINYRSKYIKIYLWRIISILLGFLSLFIVMPYISSDKILYGIFSICTSLTIFFSYADLGVIEAAQKYAAEYYIQNKHTDEIKIIGFTGFIMSVFFSIIALSIIFLSIFPNLLIPELTPNTTNYETARILLITLALSCPIIIGQRILSIIYNIRVEDYKFQKLMIIGNAIRIISVFYFFKEGEYNLIPYYIFYQCINFIIILIGLLQIKKYGYKIKDLITFFHFDNEIFRKIKKLSFASLLMIISTILYFEIDQIFISHVWDVNTVASYAIALSLFSWVRTFSSLIFSPYSARFNHFIGLKDFIGLSKFIEKLILIFAPIMIIPIISLSLFAKPFIVSWVGFQYEESANIISLLVFTFVFNFITVPINLYFIALEKSSLLNKYALIQPIIYWGGIFITFHWLGIYSLAIIKPLSAIFIFIMYLMEINKEIRHNNTLNFIHLDKILKTTIIPIITIIIFYLIISPHMILQQSREILFTNMMIIALCVFISFLTSIPFNSYYKKELFNIVKKIRKYKNLIVEK